MGVKTDLAEIILQHLADEIVAELTQLNTNKATITEL